MTYVALARRFRPQSFADVAAQSHITETLQQAVAGARVAPAYLFTGPRGSGKTTVARVLAKAVNCDKPKNGEPDGTCESCVSIADGRSLDVMEIDGASNNSVDDVRELRESVRYAPSQPGKRKVYIVDEVHMLSQGAFNAFLKTLEEPPPHVLFIFATTELRKVPETIRSRCQRFDFRRLLVGEIRERLEYICKKEKIGIDPGALFVLARRADGSLRDALSLLDQVLSSATGKITDAMVAEVLGLVREESYLELATAVRDRDPVRALGVLHAALRSGADPASFALGWVELLRNLMLLGLDPKLRSTVQMNDAHLEQATALAARFTTEDLLYLLNRAAAAYEGVRDSVQPIVVIEAALVEMARFDSRVVLTELLERLNGEGGDGPRDTPPGGGARPASGGATRASAPAAPAPGPGRGVAGGARKSGGRAEASALGIAAVQEPVAAGGMRPGIAATAAVDLDGVCARWNDFTQQLRSAKAMLAHCLAESRPVRLEAGTLSVWFPPDQNFHVHLFEEAVKRRDLEPYVATYFGVTLRLALAQDDLPGAAIPVGRRARASDDAVAPASSGFAADAPAPHPADARAEATASAASQQRLTPDDIAKSRRGAIDDVVRRTPAIDDIIAAFDGEVLDDPHA